MSQTCQSYVRRVRRVTDVSELCLCPHVAPRFGLSMAQGLVMEGPKGQVWGLRGAPRRREEHVWGEGEVGPSFGGLEGSGRSRGSPGKRFRDGLGSQGRV